MSAADVDTVSCSESSQATGEPLAGTATQAGRWLLIEVRGPWGRDVDETVLSSSATQLKEGFDGRVLLIRRPERRPNHSTAPALAFAVEVREDGGSIRGLRDSDGGFEDVGEVEGQLVVVCCHGRRDRCCARAGPPVYDALGAHVERESLWQSSHLGGHRFAANVLVLPAGVLLGRVTEDDAGRVAAAVAEGRIPLDHYRGRVIHTPELQAADAAVREALALTRLTDLQVASGGDGRVLVRTPDGEIEAAVTAEPGPTVVESCGKPPAVSVRYSVRW